MKQLTRLFPFFLMTSLGLACDSSGLKSAGSGGTLGGTGGASASGGTVGTGGSDTGGTLGGTGGATSTGGSSGKGGSGSGGSVTGGQGGSAAGGASGTGGIICPPVVCLSIGCPNGELPNPDPCGCPICAPAPDAGLQPDAGKDAGPDVCLPLPCPMPLCKPGEQIVTPTCGCSTCVPVDAGAPDAKICPPVMCPAIACVYGTVPSPDPCGCPICAGPDAGADGAKPACVGLDECTCFATSSCGVIAEACWCPFPQCAADGACGCGGGHFVGCAPAGLTTCAAARSRVGSLCPNLKGATWDNLCQQSDPCITKCLNEVSTCGDISCSMCEACDCAGDAFLRCRTECKAALTK